MKEREFVADESLLFGARKRNDTFIYIVLLVVCIILTIFALLSTYVYSCVEVSGSSMESTLQDGDILYVNRIAKVDYGDIVIIEGEKLTVSNGEIVSELIIKRVIAKGGDIIDIKDGKVYLQKVGESDFAELDEWYLDDKNNGHTYTTMYSDPAINSYPYTVPEGEVYYLGDNRLNSSDSRSHFGTCKESQIVGVVTGWSLKCKGFLKSMNTFNTKVRRFFGG